MDLTCTCGQLLLSIIPDKKTGALAACSFALLLKAFLGALERFLPAGQGFLPGAVRIDRATGRVRRPKLTPRLLVREKLLALAVGVYGASARPRLVCLGCEQSLPLAVWIYGSSARSIGILRRELLLKRAVRIHRPPWLRCFGRCCSTAALRGLFCGHSNFRTVFIWSRRGPCRVAFGRPDSLPCIMMYAGVCLHRPPIRREHRAYEGQSSKSYSTPASGSIQPRNNSFPSEIMHC